MPYDLFISYSLRDNERRQVTALKAHIESSYRAFAGRDLRVFFDTQEIAGMDDWRQKIQRSLRDSQVFLAVLSPHYLTSPYCRWEWEDYVRYEAMRQCLGEGVAPVFFVTLPDAADLKTDQVIARWVDEIHRRQTFDLRPWHDSGEQALEQAHVRASLEQLHASVRERLDRVGRARRSPNNLLKHNPAFVGRVRELTELRHALAKNKLGVVGARSAPGRVAVQGLGGMGKTELALAYAHAFAWDYPGGRWQVACEHTGDLRLALTRLAGPMGFEFTEEEKKDLALQFDRVLRELTRRERSLLILDNVSDPDLLQPEYLDRLPHDGHLDLIATTRLAPAQIPGSAQDQSFIAVDELPEEDALALMRSHQPDGRFATEAEDEEARKIVQLLRGFTLAVETAAIYLGRHPAADACASFRERLSPDLLRESEEAASDPTVAVRHRVRSLEETLAFTLETLTPEARHLLDYAALLPADQVAVSWLRSLGAKRFPILQDDADRAFRKALDLLMGLRLLQSTGVMDTDGYPLVARVHRLVQELLISKAHGDAKRMHDAVVALAFARSEKLEKDWQKADCKWETTPLRAFATHLLDRADPEAPRLANSIYYWLTGFERPSDTEPLLRKALVQQEAGNATDPTDIALTLSNLGNNINQQHRFVEAEALLRKALTIDEKHRGLTHPFIATRLNNLGGVLNSTNRSSEAEALYRRALEIEEFNYGPQHEGLSAILSNLAELLRAAGRLVEAETYYQRVLAIDEKSHGSESAIVCQDLNNFAEFMREIGRLEDAERLNRKVLAIREKIYGDFHPEVARTLNNLGLVLQASGRIIQAEPFYRRALAIWEDCFGDSHPDVASANNNIGFCLQETRQFKGAEFHYRRALEILEKVYGKKHRRLAATLNNLASSLLVSNRFGEAESIYIRALEIYEMEFGCNHPDFARSLINLAVLCFVCARLDEAARLMRRALSILAALSRYAGHEDRTLPFTVNTYRAILRKLGQSEPEIHAKIREAMQEDGSHL